MKARATQLSGLNSGLFGVVGRSISYSLSPAIFRKAFDALGWPAAYAIFDLESAQLPRFVAAAADAGISGFNVTKPYKVSIIRSLDRIDGDADAVGAVNTVVRRGNRWVGFNTDIDGVEHSLVPFRRNLAGESAVILGAGGAARAVAVALAVRTGMREITFAVRSLPKGRSLVRDLTRGCHTDCRLCVCALTPSSLNERLGDASLLVNATPVGGAGVAKRSPLPRGARIHPATVVFDLVYRPRRTRLLADAAAGGCRKLVNGWGMLVAQAEASFFLWTGKRFPDRLRRELMAMETSR